LGGIVGRATVDRVDDGLIASVDEATRARFVIVTTVSVDVVSPGLFDVVTDQRTLSFGVFDAFGGLIPLELEEAFVKPE